MKIQLRFLLAMLLPLSAGVPAFCQTTYWIPTIQSDGKTKQINYNIRVPDFFVPWVLKRNPAGGGEIVSKTINGRNYTFIKQGFTWDNGGSNPLGTGQIRIDNNKERWQSNDWQFEPKLKNEQAFCRALEALTIPVSPNGAWRQVDLMVLRSPNAANPNLQFQEAIPVLVQKKTLINDLAKRLRAGSYYNNAQVPVELARFQRTMLEIGNLGRRDPDYRKKHKEETARDLSGTTVQTKTDKGFQTEKIFKNRNTPPYFNDLVLNDALTKAAQFQAEYQAATQNLTHFGPANYQGQDMRPFYKRAQNFGYKFGMEGEGVGAGGPDTYPEGWMQSDSHFRPWFNIGAEVREVGLGIAKGANGTWYACVISGLGDPKAKTPVNPVNPATDTTWNDKYGPNSGGPVLAVNSTLTKNSPKDAGRAGCHMASYTGILRADRSYTISASSTAFDTYLRLIDANGKQVAFNDDSDGTNSKLSFRPPQNGKYTVVLTTYSAGETGTYQLSISSSPAAGGTPPNNVGKWNEWDPKGIVLEAQGTLTRNSPKDAGRPGCHSQSYSGGLRVDTTYMISASSQGFETVLRLLDSKGKQVAFKNDRNSALQALYFQPPQNGKYTVVVTTDKPGQTGTFAVSVKAISGISGPPAMRANGMLTKDSPKDPGRPGCYSKTYPVNLHSNFTSTIVASSKNFDTYLRLLDANGKQVAENDDSDGTNSKISFRPPQNGRFTVVVTTYSPGETGAFQLSVDSEPFRGGIPPQVKSDWRVPPPDAPGTVTGGPLLVTQDQLTKNSPFDSVRKGCHAKVFTGILHKNRTYSIAISSKDFDTFLRVEDASGKELAFNDDANNRLDSAIPAFRPPADGTYRIIVTTFGQGENGQFRLELKY